MPRFTTQTWNDAGLLREYLAAHYGQGFRYGLSQSRYSLGCRTARRLAWLTKESTDLIIRNAIADAELIHA